MSEHYSYSRLLKFTFPSIIMMIFTSIYGVVDGVFVSNYTGAIPFAAINLIMPFLMIFGPIGFMIGTGGTALVSKIRGEGDEEKANEIFSMLLYVMLAFGIVFVVIGEILLEPIAIAFGADEEMLVYCVQYGRILLLALPFMMLQFSAQSFLVAAERPNLGLAITVAAGLTNVFGDALFIAVLKLGVQGAAAASALSQVIGGIIPLIFFIIPGSNSPLHLGKPVWDMGALWKACSNGASEFVSNVSMSLVNIVYNYQLMRMEGANGVAAYGVIMYVNFIFISVFMGFSMGMSPIVSFNLGAENYDELKSLRKKGLSVIAIFAVVLTLAAELLARPLAMIFVSYDEALLAITVSAFMIYSISFLFMGFNLFASSFFTALNNGKVSAIISFSRALLFQIVAVLVLPMIFGINGIWMAIIVAELVSLAVSVYYLITCQKQYHY